MEGFVLAQLVHSLTSGMREVEDVPCQYERVANYRVAWTMSWMGDDEAARSSNYLGGHAGRLIDCVDPLGPAARSRSAFSLQETRRTNAYLGEGTSGAEKRMIGCHLWEGIGLQLARGLRGRLS